MYAGTAPLLVSLPLDGTALPETMAARVGREAGARRLLLTHLSPRYFPGNQTGPEELLNEARALFPEAELAHDFLSVDVERRE